MPKTRGTRKQKARELLRTLEDGPSFFSAFQVFDVEEAKMQFKLWCESWVIPVVKELIPELKEKI